jgi:hypothetical protein
MMNYQGWNNFEPKDEDAEEFSEETYSPSTIESWEQKQRSLVNIQQLQLQGFNQTNELSLNELSQPSYSELAFSHVINNKQAYQQQAFFEPNDSCLKRRFIRVTRRRKTKVKGKKAQITRILVCIVLVLNFTTLFKQAELSKSIESQSTNLSAVSDDLHKLLNLYSSLNNKQTNFFAQTTKALENKIAAIQKQYVLRKSKTKQLAHLSVSNKKVQKQLTKAQHQEHKTGINKDKAANQVEPVKNNVLSSLPSRYPKPLVRTFDEDDLIEIDDKPVKASQKAAKQPTYDQLFIYNDTLPLYKNRSVSEED